MKFNKYRCDRLLQLLAKGVPRDRACQAVGIVERTLYSWLGNGQAHEDGEGNWPEYHDFLLKFREADSQWYEKAVGVVYESIEGGNWKAALSVLSRRDRKNWSLREKEESPQPERGLDLSALTDEEIETLANLLSKAQPSN